MTQKKEKKIRSNEQVFNQYASKADGYDSKFEKESQEVQSFNFDKAQRIDKQCEMAPALHEKWLTLSAVISLLKSLKPLQKNQRKNFYSLVIALYHSHQLIQSSGD